jgi:hypothetical protein
MGLTKQEIQERLKTYAIWVTNAYTQLSDVQYGGQLDTGIAIALVPERMMRYVVGLYINGNQQKKVEVEISVCNEGGNSLSETDHTIKFSGINVAPADNVQIPEGGYSIEDPIFTMEGGTRGPYARVKDVEGHSVNLTIQYFDTDI